MEEGASFHLGYHENAMVADLADDGKMFGENVSLLPVCERNESANDVDSWTMALCLKVAVAAGEEFGALENVEIFD